MFDFGFWELILVMIVGLIVIGPKRLPRVAAQVGEWLGRMRHLVHQFRQSVQQELQAEELKDVLRQQQNEIQELRDIVQNQADPDAPLVEAIEKQLEERPDTESDTPDHEPAPKREEN
ncbi:MAG: Sec-independent protein translocase protein TatB [Gammaproteobacteria bacterium]|nr:Sec-independent protein translocase protein TatB [Gammaproteobacteria bacterium]